MEPMLKFLGKFGIVPPTDGQGTNGFGKGIDICRGKGLVPPPSEVVAPSISTSLVLVMFSSEDVKGDTLFMKGRAGVGIAPVIPGRAGGCILEILRDITGG